jgi:exo-1,4-beta-D-glucosaminidase
VKVRTVLILTALAVAAMASSAAAAVSTVGLHGWQVQSTASIGAPGAKVSRPDFHGSWLRVRPDDAGAPGTEVNALVQNGRCDNVFFSTRMKTCFGYMSSIGKDTIRQFAVPWWFRTTFRGGLTRSEHAQLIINGVVGEADVWLNGHRLATHSTVQGAFTRYTFDVTRLLHHGLNAVALKLYPNDPNTMFTLDNVDWTQIPPDNNTGIQFPIQLHVSGPLRLSDAHVIQHDARNMSRAVLVVQGVVRNESGRRLRGAVAATVTGGPRGIGESRSVNLAPGAARSVSFRVVLHHPAVWWPWEMGSQPLYQLRVSASVGRRMSDSSFETFGIRRITTRLIGASPIAPHGSRQFLVNGRPIVFRGGGWSEDLFLRYSKADTANQVAMIKNLGLNGIRTEGKQMPDDFYEQMDRAGILVDAGFQCCDAWQLQDSKLTSAHDFRVLANSARAIAENMRNHPSILNFSWSDNNPTPRQERITVSAFRRAGFQEPLIASAEYKRGVRLGWSGEKEGPYDWVPPSYWYDSSHYDPGDSSRTNVGGAWAFDSETSAGHTVPTLDSIKRFLSPFEQTQLWKNPDYNQYHANYEPDLPGPSNSGYSFGTLHDLDRAIAARYGSWSGLSEYVEKAQVQNYETQRAEFEAYVDHSTRRHAPSTGVVYWQLNKGWPTLLWDLYNHDLDEPGSFFGAKKANEPLHVLYAYDDGTVAVDNLGAARVSGLSVQDNVYTLDGKLLDHRTRGGISIGSQGVLTGLLHPRVPSGSPTRVYFVELSLVRGGAVVDRNVYWLSTKPDVVDWSKTIGNPQATMTQYADLRGLQSLHAARVSVVAHTHSAPGGLDGADTRTDVTITNTSPSKRVAFFVRADLRRGTASGAPAAGDNEVLPAFWSDNDITLWPGESETLHVSYRRSGLHGASPVVSVGGWNVAASAVRAG